MKRLLLFIVFCELFSLHLCFAQRPANDLPYYTVIPHYKLSVSYNTTTVLVFASAVKPIDKGDRTVIAQKQPGVDNVLKLKAARRNFLPTNLHVFTSDGRLYAFDLTYTDSIASTFNLSRLIPTGGSDSNTTVLFTNEPLNSEQMSQYINSVKSLPISHYTSRRHFKMKFQLETIGMASHLLFFRFSITNLSNLDYNIDFIRLYVRDKQKTKRSSIQEQEILPVYQDSETSVPGNSSIIHVVAVPAFTLADNKQLVVELFEKNGGRSVTLHLKNNQLFKANNL